jgi:hypothetical protein
MEFNDVAANYSYWQGPFSLLQTSTCKATSAGKWVIKHKSVRVHARAYSKRAPLEGEIPSKASSPRKRAPLESEFP